MSEAQADLFGGPSRATDQPSDEIVALVRARLHATLALVRSADVMPWADPLAVIREDNAFRFGKDILPPDEARALWTAFDAEMDRLCATLNAAEEPEPPA